MYVMGYSLDNLSLMALTIAVGFVVDDAIVMLENIYRYVEEGMNPMEAALRGAGEIGFTIISISISLIAVFIPLLLMGGIVGRLFREFAMTVSHRRRGIGHRLADADADDVLALPQASQRRARAALSYHRGMFDALIGGYRRTLDIALRFRFITLMVFFCTLGITGYLFMSDPQGLLPAAGYRRHHRHHRRGAGHLLPGNVPPPAGARRDHRSRSGRAAYSSSIGAGLGGQTGNNGRLLSR